MAVATPPSSTSHFSDADLLRLHRAGDSSAFAQLWERHYSAALVAARAITHSHDPDDLVQEAFARILSTLGNGNGPSENFRAYLYATIRSVSIAWSNKAEAPIDISTQENVLISEDDFASLEEDKQLTVTAFRALPDDWRTVLWYTEVEGMSPAEIAPIMGISARAVSALAFRAREGLRESWLQAHVPSSQAVGSEECRWAESQLAAYARGSLTTRRTTRMENHLRECQDCSLLLAELNMVGSSLRGILLPLVLGITPAAAAKLLPLGVAGGVAAAGAAGTPLNALESIKAWASKNQIALAASGVGIVVLGVALAAGQALNSTKASDMSAQSKPSTSVASPAEAQNSPAATASDSPQVPADQDASDVDEQQTPDAGVTTPPFKPALRTSNVPLINPAGTTNRTADGPSTRPAQPSGKPSKTPDSGPTTTPSSTTPPPASPTSVPKPSATPTSKPSPTPTDSGAPSPTTTPTPTPTIAPVRMEVTHESAPDPRLMPRFGGNAPEGSTVQIFDAENPQHAVSPAYEIPGDDPTKSGDWLLDVDSFAPTGSSVRYLIVNTRNGELLSEHPSSHPYSVQVPVGQFEVCSFKETGSTSVVPNGGTLSTLTPLGDLKLSFTLKTTHRGAFSFYLNDVARSVITKSNHSQVWSWSNDPTAPKVEGRNSISVRLVEPDDDGQGYRYGPAMEIFSFTVQSGDPLADDVTAHCS